MIVNAVDSVIVRNLPVSVFNAATTRPFVLVVALFFRFTVKVYPLCSSALTAVQEAIVIGKVLLFSITTIRTVILSVIDLKSLSQPRNVYPSGTDISGAFTELPYLTFCVEITLPS